ncbi:endonuclease/exonuclease/phosphatase family protein [Nonomuraea cavernae]|uniref:Endonuclease/exonuclease/phosphatase domain-containing protein n=1 Tax=Nonomuraea cavernae TaxID=2045107 RepID=A0A917Z6X8_9ACTN|nr:endonuclease/exonuclease/phosphatase family protein [Nonomuraea cavernae]MCA2187101.1 endonuclease/exonuclease/phosphatase family protein [Nonomuraea cavernae]GGO74751.1 hypothetical protein GCM10012289_48160 [Nonomuraea cavernae]
MAGTRRARAAKDEGGRSRPKRRGRRWPSWTFATFLALWAVVRLTGLEQGSFVTQLMTLTPLAVVVSALTALLLAARNRPAACLALAACVAFTATVAPRAFAGPAAAEGTPLRVLTINLFGRADPASVVDLVRAYNPDVFSALELTHRQVAALDAAGLGTLMPHRVLQADFGATGSGLYARHPLTALDGLFTPIGHNMPAATVSLPDGMTAQIVAVHPNPPLGRMTTDWYAAMEALPPASDEVVRVLAGDFNASLDHRALRDLLDRGYHDAAEQVGKGLVPTWPNGRWMPPLITIDHVLADRRAGVARAEILDVPGTDHRGVFAELRLPARP